jgi:large subunit ribosomal protein L23
VNSEKILRLIVEPRISEKSVMIADKNRQFTFRVIKNSTKPEIKTAVEKFFEVKVKSVEVVNVEGKNKRFKQIKGKRIDWKKAYVTLQPGYDIDFNSVK